MPTTSPADRPLPNLLFDAIELGFFTQQGRCGPDPLNAFRAALCASGYAAPSQDARRISLSVPVPTKRFSVTAELLVSRLGADGLVITSGSTIRINPLRLLRTVIGDDAAGPAALNGEDNVVGETGGRAGNLLPVQLECVRAAIDALADVIDAALPQSSVWLAERFWVKAVEVCLDHRCARAADAVRRLQRAALMGAKRAVFDVYRAQVDDGKGVPVVRWWRTEGGPVFKCYPKLSDLLRTEIECPKQPVVKEAIGGKPLCSHLDGDEALVILLQVAVALEPMLSELVEHAVVDAVDEKPSLRLCEHLGPWLMLIAGRGDASGRRPGQRSVEEARLALDALLTVGLCSATNHSNTSALRRVLDDLVVAGVLSRGGRGASYALIPA